MNKCKECWWLTAKYKPFSKCYSKLGPKGRSIAGKHCRRFLSKPYIAEKEWINQWEEK